VGLQAQPRLLRYSPLSSTTVHGTPGHLGFPDIHMPERKGKGEVKETMAEDMILFPSPPPFHHMPLLDLQFHC